MRRIVLWSLVPFLLTVSACSSNTNARKRGTNTASTASASATNSRIASAVASAPIVLVPTIPSATPASQGMLQVVSQAYSQLNQGKYVDWVILVKNSDTTGVFDLPSYQISLFDNSGLPVGSAQGYLNWVFPGQMVAATGQATVSTQPAKMSVTISPGKTEESHGLPSFAPFPGTYKASDQFSASAIGTLNNPYGEDLKNVSVVAVLYDASGKIIDGQSTFVNVVPASASVAVSIDFFNPPTAPPAKIVLYPSLSILSANSLSALTSGTSSGTTTTTTEEAASTPQAPTSATPQSPPSPTLSPIPQQTAPSAPVTASLPTTTPATAATPHAPTPSPTATPQAVVGTYVVNTLPVGCHQAPNPSAPIAAQRPPGTVEQMDETLQQSDGTWDRVILDECWVRVDPGPIHLFTNQPSAENYAATIRPTPSPTPPVATATPVTVLSASASQSLSTRRFQVGGYWAINWTYDCSNFGQSGNFIITVKKDDGSADFSASGVNELSTEGSGVQYEQTAGTYYLQVISECQWHITVTGS